ncbi:hypothetical protein DI005_20650 [Prauserella sp. PE36]|uniref:DUF3558 domain-containing protein n=1 Tax=Prauserella sp. PE36 TaxID=1504709 RepID=UPI000DE365D1|nr:DUF3558 domain-containing protein [Prauserella sp. PE36]RBM17942.1 hypothetical protein DI005_20650 [Prauserella sp. PE36]
MRSTAARAVLAVLVATVATACSGETGGQARPQQDFVTTTQASPATSAAPSSGDFGEGDFGGGLSEVDPCALLTDEELAEVGPLRDPTRPTRGKGRNCEWLPDRDNASQELLAVGVVVLDSEGIDRLGDIGNGITDGTINDRDARMTSGRLGCLISLDVGGTARVDVSATAPGIDEATSCGHAERLAEAVEPRLPQ